MKKSLLLSFILTIAALANNPRGKIHFPELHLPTGNTQIIISWDFIGCEKIAWNDKNITIHEKYFSIENFVDNDIEDGAIFSYRTKTYDSGYAYSQWHEIGTEIFENTDDFYITFEIGF